MSTASKMAEHPKVHRHAPARYRLLFHLRHHREAGACVGARSGWLADVALCRITGDDIVSGRFQNEGSWKRSTAPRRCIRQSDLHGRTRGPIQSLRGCFKRPMEPATMGQQDRRRVHHGRVRKRRSTAHTDLLFHSRRAARHALVRTGYSGRRGSEWPQSSGSQLGLATHLVDGARCRRATSARPNISAGDWRRWLGVTANHPCHCERSEAIQILRGELWIASLRSQ